ncbi:cytochrome C [Flavivirga aquatica]|uniref:Cytochrome C n=1 Tax=Flavivirga aquatica TaxID=1849968 RepID=A0A1E5TD23_9FLAO|nr:c-type cytochrome [Flavivirga aquatica]OEK09266.1 cytochrome C [Flavivirga aquatica]
MKTILKYLIVFITLFFFNCSDKKEKNKKGFSYENSLQKTEQIIKKNASISASKKIDLNNKGIGPITSLKLSSKINQTMVTHGANVFKRMCTACHKSNKKFIGPSPQNILQRRSPEWIMNMILNPSEMTQKDPLAKALLIEFNGSPMPNQSLSIDDARNILEYFRTLK